MRGKITINQGWWFTPYTIDDFIFPSSINIRFESRKHSMILNEKWELFTQWKEGKEEKTGAWVSNFLSTCSTCNPPTGQLHWDLEGKGNRLGEHLLVHQQTCQRRTAVLLAMLCLTRCTSHAMHRTAALAGRKTLTWFSSLGFPSLEGENCHCSSFLQELLHQTPTN